MTQKQPNSPLLYLAGVVAVAASLFVAMLSPLAAQSINEAVKSVASSVSPLAQTGVVTAEDTRLNVRAGPGVEFDVVAKLNPGDVVQVLDVSDDGAWYEVRGVDKDADGWAASEFIALAEPAEEPEDETIIRTRTAVTSPVTPDAPEAAETPEVLVLLPTPTPTPSSTPMAADTPVVSAVRPASVTVEASLVDTSSGDPADEQAEPAGLDSALGQPGPSFAPRVLPAVDAKTFTNTVTLTETISNDVAGDNSSGGPETQSNELGTPGLETEIAGVTSSASVTDVAGALAGQSLPVTRTEVVSGAGVELDIGEAVTATVSLTVPAETKPPVVTTPPADLTPEAESVSAIEPTPTPQPTPSVPIAVTEPDRMNVRSGPGTNYDIVTSVSAGTELEILALGPSGEWYQVNLEGEEAPAWLYAGLAEGLGPIDGLARVAESDIPPTPTPAPAPPPLAASAAPPPSGAGFFGYGIQAHLLGGQAGSALNAVNDLGFNWVKQQVEWRLYQPQAGAVGMGELGGIVSAAGNRGINVLFSVVNAPQWAREPGFDSSVGGPPADPQTYANFVGAMAGQFCGTSLKAIEIWNEQNLHYEWGNKPLNPAEYMNLLKAAYTSIKAACPEMLVISGALTPAASNGTVAMDDFAYLEAMYQNGLAAYSDGIGAHPSGYNVPANVRWEEACGVIQQTGNSFNGACDTPHHSWAFRSTMEGYRNIMTVYGDTSKRIWPTEFGWAAGGAFDPRYAYANDNSFDEQAAWTVEAYQMMKNWGWVGPAFLWNLNFRVVADGSEKAQWGIVGNDYQPLPTYNALKAMPK